MPRLAFARQALTLTCISMLALGLRSQPAAPATQGPQSVVVTGTVRTIEASTGSLELVTGVGFAMRMLRISVRTDTRITSGTLAVALTALVPGDRVRAEGQITPSGLLADRIEKLPAPEPRP